LISNIQTKGYNNSMCGSVLVTPPARTINLPRKAIIMASVPPFTGFTAGLSAWTPEEETLLRNLFRSHTHQEIANMLGRTLRAVKARCVLLRLIQRPGWTVERFWSMVDKRPNGCWIWTGRRDENGYGVLNYCKVFWRAHRFSYEVCSGLTVTNDHLHHTCENRACVNPEHLQDLTVLQHSLVTRTSACSIHREKTHCIHGHPFSEENTYIRKDNGGRMCRTCGLARAKEKRLRLSVERKRKRLETLQDREYRSRWARDGGGSGMGVGRGTT